MDPQVTQNGTELLQERLNDPKTVETLTRLLDRVEVLEQLLDQGPGMVGMMADSVDEVCQDALESGTDLEIALKHALDVATRLQNPRLVKALTRMMDQTDTLEMMAEMMEQGPGMMSIMIDSFDELQQNAMKTGLNVEELMMNGLEVARRLQNPRLVKALTRMMDQTDTLEMMSEMMEQGPGMVSIMIDSFDELQRSAKDGGIDLEILALNSLEMARGLQNPRFAKAMMRIMEQSEALEMTAEMMEQGPGMVSILVDSLDELQRNAMETGLDVEILLMNGLEVARRLQNPRLIKALSRMMEQTDTLEMAAGLLEQGPGVIAILVDSIDELQRTADRTGIDMNILLDRGLEALIKFVSLVESDEFNQFLDSGILDPYAIQVVGEAGLALSTSKHQEIPKAGPISLIKAISDPDVQRAFGFMINFARNFGQQLLASEIRNNKKNNSGE